MAVTQRNKTLVLSHEEVQRKLKRIVHQIHEENYGEKRVVLVGIAPRGMELATRLSLALSELKAFDTVLVEMSLDKDKPLSKPPKIEGDLGDLNGEVVILVDDVLQSGRTLMHAAAYLVQASLKRLSTVVLVDRRHRSFPIRADIVGLTLSTTLQEHITVKFGSKDSVYLD